MRERRVMCRASLDRDPSPLFHEHEVDFKDADCEFNTNVFTPALDSRATKKKQQKQKLALMFLCRTNMAT